MTRKNHKRGFNLIEAAIVLGVVGLVIGGIWVAAATVMENMKVNETVDGILLTSKNLQNLISVKDSASMTEPVYFWNGIIAANVFPQGWVKAQSGANAVINPYGGTVSIANNDGYFEMYIGNIPGDACIKLLTKISLIAGQTLQNAGTFDGGSLFSYTTTFPITLEDATDSCSPALSSGGESVFFFFNYTRTN